MDNAISIEKGKNALEAVKQTADVKTKTYIGMGSLITAINGLQPDTEHYWALYVDGKYADKSIDAYIIDKDTSIEIKLEKIDFSKMG